MRSCAASRTQCRGRAAVPAACPRAKRSPRGGPGQRQPPRVVVHRRGEGDRVATEDQHAIAVRIVDRGVRIAGRWRRPAWQEPAPGRGSERERPHLIRITRPDAAVDDHPVAHRVEHRARPLARPARHVTAELLPGRRRGQREGPDIGPQRGRFRSGTDPAEDDQAISRRIEDRGVILPHRGPRSGDGHQAPRRGMGERKLPREVRERGVLIGGPAVVAAEQQQSIGVRIVDDRATRLDRQPRRQHRFPAEPVGGRQGPGRPLLAPVRGRADHDHALPIRVVGGDRIVDHGRGGEIGPGPSRTRDRGESGGNARESDATANTLASTTR